MKVWIKTDSNRYVLTLEHHPQLTGVLNPYKKNQLMCTYNHPMFGRVAFPFHVKDGKVESFTLFVDGFIESDGYEFIKLKTSHAGVE